MRFSSSLATLAIAILLVYGAAELHAAGSSSRSKPAPSSNDYSRAMTLIEAGDYQNALPLLERVVRREPSNADVWNYIGFSHRKLGKFEPALAAYNKSLTLDAQHKGALEYLGELYVQTGQLDRARELLMRLDDACGFFGCKEYDDLKAVIDSHKPKVGS